MRIISKRLSRWARYTRKVHETQLNVRQKSVHFSWSTSTIVWPPVVYHPCYLLSFPIEYSSSLLDEDDTMKSSRTVSVTALNPTLPWSWASLHCTDTYSTFQGKIPLESAHDASFFAGSLAGRLLVGTGRYYWVLRGLRCAEPSGPQSWLGFIRSGLPCCTEKIYSWRITE